MKKLFGFMMIILSMSLTSCSDDDGYSLGKFWMSFGEVVAPVNATPYILTDDGSVLHIATTEVYNYIFIDGQRVYVNYTILGDVAPKEFSIRLNRIQNILSKKPVLLSTIDQDSIGDDPIVVVDAWFSAGKYLNIDFKTGFTNPNLKHFINLVQDDVQVGGEYVDLTLRHNAYGDNPTYRGYGYVSFDIRSVVPDGATSVKVRLNWKNFEGRIDSDTGEFKLNVNRSNFKNIHKKEGEDKGAILTIK